MAFDEELANRVREVLAEEPGCTEKQMFGGLAFLIDGKMALAVSRVGGLLVRVPPDDAEPLLERAHVRQFEMSDGRAPRGWLRVDPEALRTKRQLAPWVGRGVTFVRSLPAKGPRSGGRGRRS